MKNFNLKMFLFVFVVDFIMTLSLNFVMPVVQSYPPLSESFSFQRQVEAVTHIQQYIIMFLIVAIAHSLSLRILLKNINKFLQKYHLKDKILKDEIIQVRKDCISIPYKYYIVQLSLILALCVIFTLIFITDWISLFKFVIMLFAITSLIAIIQFIYLQTSLGKIILLTYDVDSNYEKDLGYRIKFSNNLIIQIIPFLAVSIIIISLLGYAKTTEEKGNSSADYYKAYIDLSPVSSTNVEIENLKQILNNIPLKNESDFYFVIPPDREDIYVSTPNRELSHFFLAYMDTFLIETNGRVYETFGTEQQAYVKEIVDENGDSWYIGFEYWTKDSNLMLFYIAIMIGVLVIYTILVYLWTNNATRNMIKVSESLENILNKTNVEANSVLPIMSNDEIGDLSYSFNKIQEMTNSNIEQIRASQDMIVEKERLASLGQMIGGIAHNLKTPIMSIAGAAEALTDLVKEYDTSIGDSEVTIEDHHEIAKDMTEWIEKTRTHLSYMSDVITAIKGQAVAFSDRAKESFTIEELVRHITILMKHELSNALINLNTKTEISESTEIKGNINSLVQVINNIISNAIQAYNGKQNENIDLSISHKDKKLVIKIQDYAGGLPDTVKDKLFKEMVTTKGKAGTGLRIIYVIF